MDRFQDGNARLTGPGSSTDTRGSGGGGTTPSSARAPLSAFRWHVLFSKVQYWHRSSCSSTTVRFCQLGGASESSVERDGRSALTSEQREQQLPEPPHAAAPPHSHPAPLKTVRMSGAV
jgi:hypothetical protein